ncbi:hypothetical protein [Spiroplasma sp. SV19]|uniref:hypothetical protein n=1 Tax=Spiroplasma sp. SV19 TaxID=2570468 RepID=UPI0024B66216|nr:hypothetical protein [Spiroplasma sp. SV19]WHQ36629.1 hypothetical protein E7Y35_01680 [Spiroplasma sp. SV19]
MPKDIFYTAKEMCNKCLEQLMQTITTIKNNDTDNINDLMFYQYNNEKEIKAITTDTIFTIKCRNKFYALFWKQNLLKPKDKPFKENGIKPEHVAEVLAFNEMLAKDMIATNQKGAIKSGGSLSYPIANSNQQLLQIKNPKRKIHHWVWIVLVILLLILLAGGGAIGYEFHRMSTRTSLINSNIIEDDNIAVVDDKDQDNKDDNDDSKDYRDNDNSKDGQDQDNNKDDQDDNDNKDKQKEIYDINISKYSFDFTQNKNNLIEVDKLEVNLIKAKLLELEDVSIPLQDLLKNDNLKIALKKEQETLPEVIIILQLDATELEGYTGQASLRLAVKIKQEVLNDVVQINGVAKLNKGANGVYETTNFKKHFEPLLKWYEKPVKFIVETWTGFLPMIGASVALSQNARNMLMSALNERYLPNREIVKIRKNGDVKNLQIQWIFSKENKKDKIIEIVPYVFEQAFDQSHFQADFKYNLKIRYTNNIT